MIFFYNGLCAIAIKRQIRAKKFMVWSVALEGILSGGQVVAARWRGSSSAWIALCLRTMRAITLYELRSNLFNFFKGSRMQNSGGSDLRICSTEFKQRFFLSESCTLPIGIIVSFIKSFLFVSYRGISFFQNILNYSNRSQIIPEKSWNPTNSLVCVKDFHQKLIIASKYVIPIGNFILPHRMRLKISKT